MYKNMVLSYSKGLSDETVDDIFNFYLQQIYRIKKLILEYKLNKNKYNQLIMYIDLILQISNENIRLKNNTEYEKSISKNF
jgi:hypothetical protein